jgi:NAD(P)-dependent dehydrogenase (short-subunit alcohol dehydrogenase family)
MKLRDQVAIVTGAGRNIGEATAKLLAAEGAMLAVVDLDQGRGERVAAEIKRTGAAAKYFSADVSDEADVEALVRAVVGEWGAIHILVNNVAVTDNKTILDISKSEWDRIIATTLTSQFLVGRQVARQMVAQGSGGRIINIGSTSGYYGRKRAIAYAAAKGGVANLTRSMAVQLAPHNIRVTSVVPNKIGSPVGKDEFDHSRPITNLRGRPGMPADLARAVLFLASDESDFVVGTELFVDGGVTAILPGSE